MKKLLLILSLLYLVVIANAQSTVVTAIPAGLTVAKLNNLITLPDSLLARRTKAQEDRTFVKTADLVPPAIGTTANLPLITTTGGVLAAGAFGAGANTFTQGNDSRLSDARTPSAHNQAQSTITALPDSLLARRTKAQENATFAAIGLPTATTTFTNKRWTARVGNTTTSATPTINTDNYDIYKLTAQAGGISSFTTNLTGTPVDGDIIKIEITGTAARAITWGTSFVASTVALPTTTVTTATLSVVFQYSTTSSYGNNKWICANTF